MTLALITSFKRERVRPDMLASAKNDQAYFHVLQDPLRILFVDDDPILREFAQVHLQSEENTVATMGDAREALQQIDDLAPDVVLLDLEMPGMSGFEFLEQLRVHPRFGSVPVIVCTGREDVGAVDRAYRSGATAFAVKPLNWRMLAYQIRFIDRTARTERRIDTGDDGALAGLAQAGWRFMQAALARHPDLRVEAGRYADALQAAMERK